MTPNNDLLKMANDALTLGHRVDRKYTELLDYDGVGEHTAERWAAVESYRQASAYLLAAARFLHGMHEGRSIPGARTG